jgi:hypothetical protein
LNILKNKSKQDDAQLSSQQQQNATFKMTPEIQELLEYKNKLENELNIKSTTTSPNNFINNNTFSTSSPTIISNSNETLNEAYKLLQAVQQQLEQLRSKFKNAASSSSSSVNGSGPSQTPITITISQQDQERFNILTKKKAELEILINKEQQKYSTITTTTPTQMVNGTQLTNNMTPIHIVNNNSNINGSINNKIPIKIRNIVTTPGSTTPTILNTSSYTMNTNLNQQQQQQQPLRTLIINNKDNQLTNIISSPSILNGTMIPSTGDTSISQATIASLQTQHFPGLIFKVLSFDELVRHGIITKDTDKTIINYLIKFDRTAELRAPEEIRLIKMNQIRMVKNHLEQQKKNVEEMKLKQKKQIHDQLLLDQKLAVECDYRSEFTDLIDAIKRLSRYHVYQKTTFEPTETESKKRKLFFFSFSLFDLLIKNSFLFCFIS